MSLRAPVTDGGYVPDSGTRPVVAADSAHVSKAIVPGRSRDERDMRVVELVVAAVAILASLVLSLPR